MKKDLCFSASVMKAFLWAFVIVLHVEASFIAGPQPCVRFGSYHALFVSSQDGLNEDGDLLMYGINANDPSTESSSSDQLGNQLIPGGDLGGLSLLGIGNSYNNNNNNNNKKQGSVPPSSPVPPAPTAGTNKHYSIEDKKQIERMETWLVEIIPTLSENDSLAYARELVGIGFDPECITQCELQLDDLHFMKVLHRRYLYNEITGQGHPWEA